MNESGQQLWYLLSAAPEELGIAKDYDNEHSAVFHGSVSPPSGLDSKLTKKTTTTIRFREMRANKRQQASKSQEMPQVQVGKGTKTRR